ncbi:hypothetical protein F3I16_01040 [Pseudomonas sp. L-22-4S-12]|uniref:hypothetical protein n=1 Tax=Pseudomonas sp. L-22-4S-12 TaxID=2610893 RepID=UPI0013260D72|nr:hypothetical protein [Pseudomonas sp. L-22-4S-12]MWV14614.1 hypothetical protein [Pseudomonas sp. L-22-4S-12]
MHASSSLFAERCHAGQRVGMRTVVGKRLWEIVQATVRACRRPRLTHNANLLTENANLHD